MIKFDIKEGKLIVKAQDLTIPVFRKIYERDKTKTKEVAVKELLYIYHMSDINSPYADTDYLVKEDRIKKSVFGDTKYSIDYLVSDAIFEYMEYNINVVDRILMDYDRKIDDLRREIMKEKLIESEVDKTIVRMKSFDALLDVREKMEARRNKTATITVRGKMNLAHQERKQLRKNATS